MTRIATHTRRPSRESVVLELTYVEQRGLRVGARDLHNTEESLGGQRMGGWASEDG